MDDEQVEREQLLDELQLDREAELSQLAIAEGVATPRRATATEGSTEQ